MVPMEYTIGSGGYGGSGVYIRKYTSPLLYVKLLMLNGQQAAAAWVILYHATVTVECRICELTNQIFFLEFAALVYTTKLSNPSLGRRNKKARVENSIYLQIVVFQTTIKSKIRQ